jgi:hypothetical protein
MFAQYDVKQVTDHCVIMHTKGWLYCWLSKHDSSVEFAQGLVKSFQKNPIYEELRKSDEIFFNLIFTRGDKKTTIVLGFNPRSLPGMFLFKQTLQWAKINGLSLEIAPNITTDDSETRQLLVDLDLSQSHLGVLKDAGKVTQNISHGTQMQRTSERQARSLSRPKSKNPSEIWEKAVGTAPNGKVIAKHIGKALKQAVLFLKDLLGGNK